MIFGKREETLYLGPFTSSKCSACKKSYEYEFVRITEFLVLFFVNLIPLRSKYQSICKECNSITDVDRRAGRSIAKKEFRSKNAEQNLWVIAKILIFVSIIAAAIVLAITLIQAPKPSLQSFKDLVSEDGVYNIEDSDGNILATVDVEDGEKTISFYDDTSILVGEDGADGSFIMHEYYYEVTDSSDTSEQSGSEIVMARVSDDPGVLEDKYKTTIRSYYYNESSDTLGYAMGIEDLTAITYSEEKAVYPYIYYMSSTEAENYIMVLFFEDAAQIKATFVPSSSGEEADELVSLSIENLTDGRVTEQTIYYFDDETVLLAESSGITPESSVDEILDFIEQQEPSATLITDFEYYENTSVVSGIDMTQPDSSGEMQTVSLSFEVTEKGGYYIQQAIEE